MSTENSPLFTEEEIRYLRPGRIRNVEPSIGAGGNGDKKPKCKYSINTYVHPSLRHKFQVEIIGGRTKAEHGQIRNNLRVAAKVIERTDSTSVKPLIETPKSISETSFEEDSVQIQFTLVDPERYKPDFYIQFMLDSSAGGSSKDNDEDPVPITTDKDKPITYKVPSKATEIEITIELKSFLNSSSWLHAILYSLEKPFKKERPSSDYVVYEKGNLPDNKEPTKRVITLSTGGVPLTMPIAFAARVESNTQVSSTLSVKYG